MEGISEGQDIRKKYEDAAQRAMARRADANYSAWLQQAASKPKQPDGGPAPAPQPGMGGPAPAPQPGVGGPAPAPAPALQSPRPVPMPGATPMPGAQPQGQPPQAGPAPSVAPQGPMPMPQPMAAKPPMPPPGAGAPPAPGGPSMGKGPAGAPSDPVQDPMLRSQQYIQSVAKEMLQAFPNKQWKPEELLDTVMSVINHSNALNADEKQLNQALLAVYKGQLTAQLAGNRDETTRRGQDLSHGDRQDAIRERIQSADWQHMDRQERNSLYGDFVTLSHEDKLAAIQAANDRNDHTNATHLQAIDDAVEGRHWDEVQRLTASEDNAETGAQSREYAAQVGNSTDGGKGIPVPKPVRTPLGTPPSRRNAASPSAPYPGAKKAPDGNWYVPDPKRPGKYLKVG